MYYKYIYITIFVLGCINHKHKNKVETTKDSIHYWISVAKNKKYTIAKRKQNLQKAYANLTSDSLRIKYLTTIAYVNLKIKDTTLFKKQSEEILELALKQKDSFVVGDVYWGYASFYRDFKNDSAFYYFDKGQRFFKQFPYHKAKMLYAKSSIYNGFSDYGNAEESCIKALYIFKSLHNIKEIGNCYNSLGIILEELNNYKESLECYQNSLKYLKTEKDQRSIYNNIGTLYKVQKDYSNALIYFKKSLTYNLPEEDLARVNNNIAHLRLLSKDTLGVYKDLKKSLSIRKKLNYKEGVLSSYLSLSDYFLYKKDTVKGVGLLKRSTKMAYKLQNNKVYLNTLLKLANYDKLHQVYYFKKYIHHKDSVAKVKQDYLQKIYRYSYQTDELINKNKFLEKQNDLLLWISLVLTFVVFGYYYIQMKTKNEKLVLENESQKLNEELYLLAIENQQKIKVTQIEERNRIAMELHDGILSKLFGVRLKLGFFPSYEDKKTQIAYEQHVQELQQLEKEIRTVSHQLHSVTAPYAIDFENAILNLFNEKKAIGKFELIYDKGDEIYLNHLDDFVKVNLFRIMQESLQNVVKHANAQKVVLKMCLEKNKLYITIKDDGVGFNEKKVKKGLGIKSMKSRINKIKGELFFNQNEVLLILPFKIKTDE